NQLSYRPAEPPRHFLPTLLLSDRAFSGAQRPPATRADIAAPKASVISIVVQETLQPLRARRVPKLAQRLRLDLPDALASDVELLADLLQGVVGVHFDTEAHAQHFGFPRSERIQNVLGNLPQRCVHRRIVRCERRLVLDEVSQMRVVVVADRRFHRYRLL